MRRAPPQEHRCVERKIQRRDKITGRIAIVHGGFGTPEYEAWRAMMKRCYCESNASYHYYGGRGISVCRRWMSFSKFIADMGLRPSADHSLGRRNNNIGYRPSNCRWETRGEQQSNRRSVVELSYAGLTMPLSHWAERTGLARSTISARLRRNWPAARALTIPADSRRGRWK